MSSRREMLQVARLAPRLLGDSRDLVGAFLRRSVNPDGGFQDRGGASDLYYTVFGLEGLIALAEPVPERSARYLAGFGDGAALDFVHLTCLARAWASVSPTGAPPEVAAGLRPRLDVYQSIDGGYAVSPRAPAGTPYACFLALGAMQDLALPLPEPGPILQCLAANRAADGGYANHAGAPEGSTPATAAAVMVMRQIDQQPDAATADWLRARFHAGGGFFAAPHAPMPDLLSTATALHALAALHVEPGDMREPCLDFVDSLWTSAGGFHGTWADDVLDCEYTYYGLLALGHLAL